MSRPALSRRVMRQYQQILLGDASSYFWSHPYACTAWSGKSHPEAVIQANAWQAYLFAKQWHGRNIDVKRLQRIVLRSDDAECATLFALHVPGASLRRLEQHVLSCGRSKDLRHFASRVPGANAARLEAMAVVYEVMGQ